MTKESVFRRSPDSRRLTNWPTLLVAVVIIGLLAPNAQQPRDQQQVVQAFDFLDEEDAIPCRVDETTAIERLGPECQMLEIYNQTEMDAMEPEQLIEKAKVCACQLTNMHKLWLQSFDNVPETRRVFALVQNTINGDESGTIKHPPYLWSDIDVTVYKISIYTATKDYFEQVAHNASMVFEPSLRRYLDRHPIWRMIRKVCRRLIEDPFKLYRYLENLNRISPVVFIRLVTLTEAVEFIYQASKACKLLLIIKFNQYKLKPDSPQLVLVDPENSLQLLPNDEENSISNDVDQMLRSSSALLLHCNDWEKTKSSLANLTHDCPMMISEHQIPTDWLRSHRTALDRSQMAVKCGCQLLLHNSTWSIILKDKNVDIMSRALTKYMNSNMVPDFANTPIHSIHGWFQNIMLHFIKNKKNSVKEIVKTLEGSQDPVVATNKDTSETALELLRRGCNYIMFNHRKGSKEVSELMLVRYLDNLQLISQDPLFVFHLTLQDADLFKLHALSKMCEPVVH